MKINSSNTISMEMDSKVNINKAARQSNSFAQQLESAVKQKDQEKLYASCQALESVFLNKVFASMLKSVPRSEFIHRGFATETFESMLYEEYSKEISKTNATGIADILYRQLSKNL